MTEKPRVVLIDLSSLWWQAWMVNHENGVQMARTITLDGVKRCMVDPSDLVAICCDSGRSFRKDLSAEYKAQREKQPEAAYGELERCKERLRADGHLLWAVDNFEADDVIATATKMALDRGHCVRICSSDKDMFQLINIKVDCMRTHTWTLVGPREFMEKFRIEPEQFCDWLALKGDTSDNIPGCKGIGDVRASELLTKYETLDRIYEALEHGKQVATPSNEKNLREQKAAVMLSRKLVELRYDVPLNFDEIFAERKTRSIAPERNEKLADESDIGSSPKDEPVPNAPDSSLIPASNGTDAKPATEMAQYVAPAAVEFERQLEPRSIRAAQYLADRLWDSRLYTRFPNADGIFAVIIRGRELGLGALTSLDSFHLIEGRPCPHAYLMIARAKADPDCEYLYCEAETSDDKSATWVTKSRRNPVIQRFTYTIEMARASGLIQPAQEKTGRDGRKYMSKDNQWVVRPAEMLRKTAGVQLARMEYPAATMGLYAWEEMAAAE